MPTTPFAIMPLRAPDNANALAPVPRMDEKKDSAAEMYEDAELGNDEKREPTTAPEMPECLVGLSPEERTRLEKKLVRKIDLRLLPMLVLMYIMNYLDRNNIASARYAGKKGMIEDLGMTSTQYNVSGALPTFGRLN